MRVKFLIIFGLPVTFIAVASVLWFFDLYADEAKLSWTFIWSLAIWTVLSFMLSKDK